MAEHTYGLSVKIYPEDTDTAHLRTVLLGTRPVILIELQVDDDDQATFSLAASHMGDTPQEVADLLREMADGLDVAQEEGEPVDD